MPLCGALAALHRDGEAVEQATRELALRTREGEDADPRDLAEAWADLGLALTRSKRDVPRGRRLLVEARAAMVKLGSPTRLPAIDAALGRGVAKHD